MYLILMFTFIVHHFFKTYLLIEYIKVIVVLTRKESFLSELLNTQTEKFQNQKKVFQALFLSRAFISETSKLFSPPFKLKGFIG
jgi:hypothetical protein